MGKGRKKVSKSRYVQHSTFSFVVKAYGFGRLTLVTSSFLLLPLPRTTTKTTTTTMKRVLNTMRLRCDLMRYFSTNSFSPVVSRKALHSILWNSYMAVTSTMAMTWHTRYVYLTYSISFQGILFLIPFLPKNYHFLPLSD